MGAGRLWAPPGPLTFPPRPPRPAGPRLPVSPYTPASPPTLPSSPPATGTAPAAAEGAGPRAAYLCAALRFRGRWETRPPRPRRRSCLSDFSAARGPQPGRGPHRKRRRGAGRGAGAGRGGAKANGAESGAGIGQKGRRGVARRK